MKKFWRSLRAGWRDTLILIHEFKTPLTLFTITVIGGGIAYYLFAQTVNEPVQSVAEAVYKVLAATFLQPLGEFPEHFVLQLFHFVMPIV